MRKGKGRATSLAPANRAGISVVALASVVASPGFWGLPFRGTSAPLTCGTFGVAGPSQAVRSLEVKEGERGLGRELRFCQVNPVPVAGIRRACRRAAAAGLVQRQKLRPAWAHGT